MKNVFMFRFIDTTPREFIYALVRKCFFNSFCRCYILRESLRVETLYTSFYNNSKLLFLRKPF